MGPDFCLFDPCYLTESLSQYHEEGSMVVPILQMRNQGSEVLSHLPKAAKLGDSALIQT